MGLIGSYIDKKKAEREGLVGSYRGHEEKQHRPGRKRQGQEERQQGPRRKLQEKHKELVGS